MKKYDRNMSEDKQENGATNGDVPEIELIIKVSKKLIIFRGVRIEGNYFEEFLQFFSVLIDCSNAIKIPIRKRYTLITKYEQVVNNFN